MTRNDSRTMKLAKHLSVHKDDVFADHPASSINILRTLYIHKQQERALRECKPTPTPKFEPTVIWDSAMRYGARLAVPSLVMDVCLRQQLWGMVWYNVPLDTF